jgi:hypothetical protein
MRMLSLDAGRVHARGGRRPRVATDCPENIFVRSPVSSSYTFTKRPVFRRAGSSHERAFVPDG